MNLCQTDICIVYFITTSLRKKIEQQTHPQIFPSKVNMETEHLEIILTYSGGSFKNRKEVIREYAILHGLDENQRCCQKYIT